jgi:hypothetical protein
VLTMCLSACTSEGLVADCADCVHQQQPVKTCATCNAVHIPSVRNVALVYTDNCI